MDSLGNLWQPHPTSPQRWPSKKVRSPNGLIYLKALNVPKAGKAALLSQPAAPTVLPIPCRPVFTALGRPGKGHFAGTPLPLKKSPELSRGRYSFLAM